MCCVMPPASPAATSVSRIASSSEVLPWSTWPMIGHDRRALDEVLLGVLEDRLELHVVGGVDDLDLLVELLGEHLDRVVGERLRERRHLAEAHQLLDHLGHRHAEVLGDVLDGRAGVDAHEVWRRGSRRCCRSGRSCRRRCRAAGGRGGGGAEAGWRGPPAGGGRPASRSPRAGVRRASARGGALAGARVARGAHPLGGTLHRGRSGCSGRWVGRAQRRGGGLVDAGARGGQRCRRRRRDGESDRRAPRRAPPGGPHVAPARSRVLPPAERRLAGGEAACATTGCAALATGVGAAAGVAGAWRAAGAGAEPTCAAVAPSAPSARSARDSSTEEDAVLTSTPAALQPFDQRLAGDALLLGDLVYALLAHWFTDSTISGPRVTAQRSVRAMPRRRSASRRQSRAAAAGGAGAAAAEVGAATGQRAGEVDHRAPGASVAGDGEAHELGLRRDPPAADAAASGHVARYGACPPALSTSAAGCSCVTPGATRWRAAARPRMRPGSRSPPARPRRRGRSARPPRRATAEPRPTPRRHR